MDSAWLTPLDQAFAGGRRSSGGVRQPTFHNSGGWGMTGGVKQVADDLRDLMAGVAAGRPQALESLYQRTSAKLYGIGLRLLGDETEAQDLLQDVYTLAWTKADRFDPSKAGVITWLATLTRNKAIDRLRARRPADEIDAAANIADDQPDAFAVAEQAQDAARLTDCLGKLDDRAGTMIRAAFFEGLTYPELARREDVPLPTMKSWIRRGLARLKECLER